MENSDNNPYTAPKSSVDAVQAGRLGEVFDRFSAWGVFGLSFITLGLYFVYWLYSRTQRMNQRAENPISTTYTTITLALYLLSLLSNLVTFYSPEVGAVMALVGFPGGIMMIVWVFMLRGRIHEYLGLGYDHPDRFGPILTFFFSALYMQYKINKIIDKE